MKFDTSSLLLWIAERETIRHRRAEGAPPPWSADPIFQKYSFCNVRREDDRTTRWIAANWREPHADDQDLWFAMVVGRFVNRPDTLAELGFPVPWEPEHFLKVMSTRKARGEICFGAAYNIGNAGQKTAKPEHLVTKVFAPLCGPLTRKRLRPKDDDTLHTFYGRLKAMPGFDSFMAGQIVADMKYVAPLKHSPDWFTFAVPGPGSRRGLNRVLGRAVEASWRDEDTWRAAFRQLRDQMMPELERIGLGDLHAQDLQNCLCEFDKMERGRRGDGKLKRRFVPRGE
jgi:hypothetical protein